MTKLIRFGIITFFLLVLVDGAVRKWVFPEFQQIVYVIKDIVLFGILLVYLTQFRLRNPFKNTVAGTLLLLYVSWCAVEAFNAALPNYKLGLWGLKNYALYASLVLLIPAAYPSFDDLFKSIKHYLLVSFPVLLLGIAQFFAPTVSVLNKYAHQTAGPRHISTFGIGHFPRITGTFSYISGMVTFVFFVLLTGIAILLADHDNSNSSVKEKIAFSVLIVVSVVTTIMTGSRWPVYVWFIAIPVLGWETYRTKTLNGKVILSFLAVIVVSSLVFAQYGNAFESFIYRATHADDDASRIEARLLEPYAFVGEAGLIGYGAGATYQAANVLTEAVEYSWLPIKEFEAAPGRRMLELGLIGFIVLTGLYVSLSVLAHRTSSQCTDPRKRMLCIAALIFFVVHLTEHVASNATANAFFWGFAGILAKIVVDLEDRAPTI